MKIIFRGYHLGYKIVSFAKDEYAKEKLTNEGLDVVYLDECVKELVLLPESVSLSQNSQDLDIARTYNNYDVFEIWDTGLFSRLYNDKSDDNYFFITGRCNSNCIMCPSSEHSRRSSSSPDYDSLIALAKHIPSDTPHLTITGGEPFLMGEQIFLFINYLKEKFRSTEFLFLTNGRIFSITKYAHLFCDSAPENSIVAIPIHGSCQEIHDSITRSDGSFKQTYWGIKKLLKCNVRIEIRLVVSKMNVFDFDNIAKLIIDEFKDISYVSIIAMEMTGAARTNIEKVWLPYGECFSYIKKAVRDLISNGIDVKLYNFPLCTVERSYWTLCSKSISDNKVRYDEKCLQCRYKDSCSGIFSGTLQLEKAELRVL